ncbi:ANTAR domain-containing protein [Nocardia vinacea]|uniref:ANTAR domain-containing protein n=1 Tax=Nocardia vinacea TaxID=96468 RepID=A0ABZ1YPI3_9NOCA|nr:ANTAR domain-containing protein [Nocardia vinacea]
MLTYAITAEQAFQVLIWRSQETNTKLRHLAAQLIAELPSLGATPLHRRTQLDHLLLTVHQRIARSDALRSPISAGRDCEYHCATTGFVKPIVLSRACMVAFASVGALPGPAAGDA